jgi:hypothetical protein
VQLLVLRDIVAVADLLLFAWRNSCCSCVHGTCGAGVFGFLYRVGSGALAACKARVVLWVIVWCCRQSEQSVVHQS